MADICLFHPCTPLSSLPLLPLGLRDRLRDLPCSAFSISPSMREHRGRLMTDEDGIRNTLSFLRECRMLPPNSYPFIQPCEPPPPNPSLLFSFPLVFEACLALRPPPPPMCYSR
eukprot:RCo043944